MKHALVTITNSANDFGGGVFTWIKRITQALPSNGWRVTTVTHAVDEPGLESWLKEASGITLKPILGRYARLNEIDAVFAHYVEEQRPDAVIINSSYWMVPTLQRLKRQGANLRIVGVCHADSNAYYDGLVFYRDCFDHVVAVSETCHQKLLALGYNPAHVTFLPYGVPCAGQWSRPIREGPLRLVYVGRLVQQQKRILDFIPLVRRLNENKVDYRLDFYGAGAEEKLLREEIGPVDAEERVSFHGWVPSESVAEVVWPASDVFLLLSDYEGLSISMLEAMGAGVTPVVSRVASGIAEAILEGETGYTFPVGDIEACADIIASLDRERARLVILSRQAWQRASHKFSLQAHVQRLAAILNETLERPARTTATRHMGVTAHPLARLVPGWMLVSARKLFKRGNPRSRGYTTYL